MSQRHGTCVPLPPRSVRSLSIKADLTGNCPSACCESWPSRGCHPLAHDVRLLDQQHGDSCTRCNHLASFREFPSSRGLTKLCISYPAATKDSGEQTHSNRLVSCLLTTREPGRKVDDTSAAPLSLHRCAMPDSTPHDRYRVQGNCSPLAESVPRLPDAVTTAQEVQHTDFSFRLD
ncbi:hypothetical protein M3J09_006651 [Ascochyta lentis]